MHKLADWKKYTWFISGLLFLQLLFNNSLYAQIVIEDGDITLENTLSTHSLIGYRKADLGIFYVGHHGSNKTGIPVNVFIESAKSSQAILASIKSKGKNPETATLNDWFGASKIADKGWRQDPFGEAPSLVHQLGIQSIGFQVDLHDVDTFLISSLPETELFGSNTPITYTETIGGKEVELIETNSTALIGLSDVYTSLLVAGHQPPSRSLSTMKNVKAQMANFPFLEKASEIAAGQVTFGEPIVYSASERGLQLPRSIIEEFDVHWVQFAVSFRDVQIDDIAKLTFGVVAPASTTALELLPLRFDEEKGITQIYSSPDIKVQYGDKAIELGKFYEQQVVYKSLSPTIVAEGLQENIFSWSLMNSAVQSGAKRFIAILKVPKGKKSLTLQLQASVKDNSGHIFQGNIASTEPKLVEINLN